MEIENPEHAYLYFVLPNYWLKKMDAIAHRLGDIGREKALLSSLQDFAKKYGIILPGEPVATPYVPKKSSRIHKRKQKQSVGLLVPWEREDTWLTLLLQKTGIASPKKLVLRVLDEYDPG